MRTWVTLAAVAALLALPAADAKLRMSLAVGDSPPPVVRTLTVG